MKKPLDDWNRIKGSNKSQKKGEDGMRKAGKRQKMTEDRSSERVPCEKVVCEKVYTMHLKKYV
jgi:hypothetical protein